MLCDVAATRLPEHGSLSDVVPRPGRLCARRAAAPFFPGLGDEAEARALFFSLERYVTSSHAWFHSKVGVGALAFTHQEVRAPWYTVPGGSRG